MHPVSILTFGIFFAGYITARWDLVTRLYELAIFAWDYGVIVCCDGHADIRPLLTLCRPAPRKALPPSPSCSYYSSYQSSALLPTRPNWLVHELPIHRPTVPSLTTRRNRANLRVQYLHENNCDGEAHSRACSTSTHSRRAQHNTLLAMGL